MKRFVRILFGVSLAFSMLNVLPVKAEGAVQLKEPQKQQTANDGSQVPEIISIEMDRTTMSPGSTINFTMRFNDNGLNATYGYIDFRRDGANSTRSAWMHPDSTDPEVWIGDMYMDEYAYGKYEIFGVYFYNDYGNEFRYNTDEYYYSNSKPLPEEFRGLYYTVDNPNPDTEAPKITLPLVFSKTVLDGNSDTIQVTADIQDDGSGFSNGYLSFQNDRGGYYTVNFWPDGPIEIRQNLDQSYNRLYDGVYHLTQLSLTDNAGNSTTMSNEVWDPATQVELPAELAAVSFEVKNCTPSGTWQTDSNGTKYVFDDGTSASGMILDIDGVTYVFNYNGYLHSGWYSIDENRVYGENGVVAKSKWIEGMYYVKEDGFMARSEWVDGGQYYVDRDGRWIKNAIKGQVNEIYPVYSDSGASNSATLMKGETVTFQYELVSDGVPITGNEVTWSSSDTSVATVAQNGKVTTVGYGYANIKASLANGNYVSYYVNCIKKAEALQFRDDAEFRLSDEYLAYEQYRNKFYATNYVMVLPEEGNGTEITVTSSDPSVINTDGSWFSIVGKGKCTLTFTPASNPDVSISHEFEVYESAVPQSVELIRVPNQVFVGYMYPNIEAVYSPEESKINTLWTSSDPNVVTAPDPEWTNGNIFYLSNIKQAGTVTVTAQSRYDASVSATATFTAVNGSPANGTYDVIYRVGEIDPSDWSKPIETKNTREAKVEVGKTYGIFISASSNICVPTYSIGRQFNQQFFANNPGLAEVQFQGGMGAAGPGDPNIVIGGWPVCFTVNSEGTYTYTLGGQSLRLSTENAGTWKQDSTGWWYDYGDGTYPKSEFKDIDGKTYYFKDDGYMATEWVQVGEDWYYMGTDGAMVKSQAVGEYYVKADGKMARNEEINGVYYGADGKKTEMPDTEVHEVTVTADFEEPHPGNILGFPANIKIPANVKYMTPEEYNETMSGQGVGDTSGAIFFGTIDNRETRYTWEDQILESGMEFFYQYTVYAKEGYTFAEDVTAKFNEKEADQVKVSDDKKLMTLYVQYGPLSHTMTHVEAKAATCTEDGNIEYYECSVCEKKYEDEEGTTEITTDVVLPKTGHNFGEWTVTKEATCTEAGEETRVCANDPTHKETREIEKLAHNMTHVEGTPATCTEDGLKEYYECSLCNKKYEDEAGTVELTEIVIPKKGHDYGEWQVVKAVTCTEDGEETRICANDPTHTETRVVEKLGHAMTHVEAKDPTCTEDGNVEYYECGNCGKKFADEEGTTEITTDVVLPKKGHTPEEALSSDSSYHFHKCEVCGEPVEETKEAHTWTEWEKDLSAGTQTRKCTVCGYTETKELPNGTWKQDSTGWWYDNGDGTYPKNEIKTIKGTDYYFNASGYMVTGWAQINGKWYVFDSSGAMKKNTWEGNYYLKEDGTMAVSEWVDNNQYYVGADGKWIPDYGVAKWKQDSTGWWYDNGDGTYPHGEFKTIDSTEYYFKENGYIATGWTQIGGKWYVFDSSGAMKKNAWEGNYYLKEDGTMAVSEWVDNNQYYVGADGAWIPDYGVAKWKQDANGWWYDNGDGTYPHGEIKTIEGADYYFKENGYMATGWTLIDGKWYVFTSSGTMKKNAWEGNYWLGADGVMVTDDWVDNDKYYVGSDGAWVPGKTK